MGYPRTGSQSAPWTIFQISPISISSFFSCILYMSAQIVDGFPIFLLYIYKLFLLSVAMFPCHRGEATRSNTTGEDYLMFQNSISLWHFKKVGMVSKRGTNKLNVFKFRVLDPLVRNHQTAYTHCKFVKPTTIVASDIPFAQHVCDFQVVIQHLLAQVQVLQRRLAVRGHISTLFLLSRLHLQAEIHFEIPRF